MLHNLRMSAGKTSLFRHNFLTLNIVVYSHRNKIFPLGSELLIFRAKWIPCNCETALPQVADDADDLQTWTITVNIRQSGQRSRYSD
jgi:hypothetical protein